MRTSSIFFSWVVSIVPLVSGCSTNPLPSDVTGLSVYEIAHKIRCEGRDAVDAEFHKAGYSRHQLSEIASANATIKKAKKAFDGRFGPPSASLEAERERLAAQEKLIRAEIERLAARLNGYTQAVLAKDRSKLTAQQKWLLDHLDAGDIEDDFEKLQKWLASKFANEQKIRHYNTRIALLRRDQALASQEFARMSRAQFAKHSEAREFLNHTFAFALRFAIEELNDARVNTADFTRAITFGTITVGVTAGDKKKRKGTREVRVAAKFGELLALDEKCLDTAGITEDGRRFVLRYPIKGKIGIDEVVAQYRELLKNGLALNNTVASGHTYSNIITFTTIIDGSIKPSALIKRPSNDQFKGDGLLQVQREDVHEVTVALVPPKNENLEETDKIYNVRLVHDDSIIQH